MNKPATNQHHGGVEMLAKGYPPIIREDLDNSNARNGRRIVWFRKPRDTGPVTLMELRYIKIRGRRTLPALSWFNDSSFDVLAVEFAAAWEQPISGGYFLRRVVVQPKTSPLIAWFSFSPGDDQRPEYVFGEPEEHTEAKRILKILG